MKSRLFGAILSCLFAFYVVVPANAALVANGAGVIDTDRNITWLRSGAIAAKMSFGLPDIRNGLGLVPRDLVQPYLAAMNADIFLGFSDWRLPTSVFPDPACTDDTAGTAPSSDTFGYNCTGSEMGHLFYEEMQGEAGTSILESGDPTALSMFTDIKSGGYWVAGVESGNESYPSVCSFSMSNGAQGASCYQDANVSEYLWVVRDGTDALPYSALPIPPALYLFGTGLIGLVGMARRKNA